MSDRFGYHLEPAYPAAVLGLCGRLDAGAVAELRDALTECLAEQPAGLLIDVSGLSLIEDPGLSVLTAVARDSGRWPGTRFAIFGGTADLTAAAERVGLTRYVPVYADRASAQAELSRWPVPPARRLRIRSDRFAPGIVRAAVHDFCDTVGVSDSATAQLVASELVTNAVVHAGTQIDVTLRLRPPHLHIAVRDGAGGNAQITAVAQGDAERGRGLVLVDALATEWGSFVPHRGKIVWATVRVPSGAAHPTQPLTRGEADRNLHL